MNNGKKIPLGGERLGSGKKNDIYLHGFGRSTHNQSSRFKTTMSAGTLVPCLNLIGLPGSEIDIELGLDALTHPAINPLFGSFKIEAHVFKIPYSLYQPLLKINMFELGREMDKVKLPILRVFGQTIDGSKPINGQQINPSCLLAYLGMRGIGYSDDEAITAVRRDFNGTGFIGYYDICGNYYCNKQEKKAYFIHNNVEAVDATFIDGKMRGTNVNGDALVIDLYPPGGGGSPSAIWWNDETTVTLNLNPYEEFDVKRFTFVYTYGGETKHRTADTLFKEWTWNPVTKTVTGSKPYSYSSGATWGLVELDVDTIYTDIEPRLQAFDLTNISEMNRRILMNTANNGYGPYVISQSNPPLPYVFPQVSRIVDDKHYYAVQSNQEGLMVNTYMSDINNNWLRTEWVVGVDGVNELTKIPVVDGHVYIDTINLHKKLYNLLTRITLSGGSIKDYIFAGYGINALMGATIPTFEGGISKELRFEQIVSNNENTDGSQPLGTLAGRGYVSNEQKGGRIKIKCNEWCYIMGIVTIRPRVDYSQGNKWFNNIESMGDFHVPDLDKIGFQDLVTDTLAWFDTKITTATIEKHFKSAGKTMAWINYQTDIDEVYGNFALEFDQMSMVLNRNYEMGADEFKFPTIKDLTTYIDPIKWNQIFANTRRDAQNFWVQVNKKITVRHKMSANQIPSF